jgi:hypothetical protein
MAVSASVTTVTSDWAQVAGPGVATMPRVLWQNQGPKDIRIAFNPDGPAVPDLDGAYLLKVNTTFLDETGSVTVYAKTTVLGSTSVLVATTL